MLVALSVYWPSGQFNTHRNVRIKSIMKISIIQNLTIPFAKSTFEAETRRTTETVGLRWSLASHTERVAVQAVVDIQILVRSTDDRHTPH